MQRLSKRALPALIADRLSEYLRCLLLITANKNLAILGPYCSNPRAFLGKCYTCDQLGHRAADCPSKAKVKPEVKTKVKFETKASLNKKDINKAVPAQAKSMVGQNSHYSKGAKTNEKEAQASFPPMIVRIVFVKDVGRASVIDKSTRDTSHRSTSAQSSATDESSVSQPSANSPSTSSCWKQGTVLLPLWLVISAPH